MEGWEDAEEDQNPGETWAQGEDGWGTVNETL